MKELLEILDAMTSHKGDVENPRDFYHEVAERIVKHVTGAFACRPDEVAILIVTSDAKHLRFVAPRKFADLGTIPVTKRDSIAVNVLQKKTGDVMNNVPMVKHVAFFESVKLRDKSGPIQKMITIPILYGGEAVGVAQISRKGDTPSAAGADFTPGDLDRAQKLFQGVAPYLVDARPDRF